MKFTIQREDLLKPLQAVIGVVERRQTLPILANVLLTVNSQTLSLLGTDLEVELIGKVELSQPAEIGQITVPARKLFDICRNLPDGTTLQFTQEENRMVVKCGRSRFILQTLPATDFPNIDEAPSAHQFKISQANLKHLLEQTHFAIAQQDVRYYLNGMLLELSDSQIRTVATDGHRMALCTMLIKEPLSFQQVIIPRKGVSELLRLLENNDEEVTVILGQHHLRVQGSHFTLTTKLIDGRYPDYKKVLPNISNKQIQLNRDEFKQALSRVAILSSEKFRGVALNLRENQLELQASNLEQEEAEERIDIQYVGQDVTLGFNVSYLLDVLNTIPNGDVKITVADGETSLLMEPSLSEKATSLFVVMPVLL